MTQVKMSPLRRRLIEDMRIRGMGDKAQKSHIRAIKDFAVFLGRSPDTATPEDLRADQLHMSGTGVTPSTFNTRIVALRFFFGMTCPWSAPIEWSSLNVNAWSVAGPSVRGFRALVDGIPMRCAA